MKLRTRNGYYWVEESYYDALGKHKRLQRTTNVKDDGSPEAERFAQDVAQKIWSAVVTFPQTGPVGAKAVGQTIAHAYAANLAKKHVEGCSEATIGIVDGKRKPVEAFFGAGMKVAELTDNHYRTYAAQRFSTGIKSDTVLRELGELSYGLRALGLTAPEMPSFKLGKPRERVLSPADTQRLLAVVPAKRRDYVLVYRLTGIRFSELYQIEATDIDFAENTVRIRGTKTDGADRVIPMHPNVATILRERTVTRPGLPLFEMWSTSSHRELQRYATNAGLGRLSFNDLRRSFATELVMAGESTPKIAALLGHRSTRMVEQVYGRIFGRTKELQTTIAKLATYTPKETPTP